MRNFLLAWRVPITFPVLNYRLIDDAIRAMVGGFQKENGSQSASYLPVMEKMETKKATLKKYLIGKLFPFILSINIAQAGGVPCRAVSSRCGASRKGGRQKNIRNGFRRESGRHLLRFHIETSLRLRDGMILQIARTICSII